MGVSTDGILVFGIDLGEEELEFLHDFENDFDEFLHSLSGLPDYGEPGHDYVKDRDFVNSYPVDLVWHCSYQYPMYILAIRGTETTAARGYPQKIDPSSLVVANEKIEFLKKFCETYGIEWQEPKWYLCSMWG